MAAAFTFGIEEEYFLVDAETKLVAREMPQAFFEAAEAATDGPHLAGIPAAADRGDLVAARDHGGCARRAARTASDRRRGGGRARPRHPRLPAPIRQRSGARRGRPQKERYDKVMHDLQMIGQRDMLCGLHVHVELPDPDARVDVMYRMLPYLPLFLALSTSSPFWQSRRTGLKGYRLAAYDELPRTGVPELFRTEQEFDAYVAALVRAGVIKDSSYIWWAIRPSLNNPTLELRAPDSCTLVEDAIAIAALYRTLARHLYLNPWRNADLDAGRPRDHRREQMAGAALRRAWHFRHRGRRGARSPRCSSG